MVKLGDVCTKGSSSITLKDLEERDGCYPIYGASGFIKNVDFYQQEQPYVAVVKDGAGVGRVMCLPAKSSVIGTMQYIIPNDGVNVKYLVYALEYMNLAKYYTGATIPHIYFKDYCKELLPSHTKEEQEHIATVLNNVEGLIALRKEQITRLEPLIKSRFTEMFNTKDFPLVAVEAIAQQVFAGGDKPKDMQVSKDAEHCYPVFANGESNYGLQGFSRTCKVKFPALTVSARGTVGYCCIREAGFTPIVRLVTLVPKDCVSLIYLKEAICFTGVGASGAVQAQLTVPNFKKLQIPLPPMDLQNQFAAFVEQIDKSKFELKQSLEKLETLKKSLMQQYFG